MELKSLRTDDFISAVLERYGRTVYTLALSQTRSREDAEDVFQEVFLRLMERKAPFESEEHRKAWLIRVTLSRCRSLFASAYRKKRVPLSEDIPFSPPGRSALYDAVLALPRGYRTVIHLHYYEGYSTEEIARLLTVRPSTVRSRLFRARKLLKDQLGGEFLDESL